MTAYLKRNQNLWPAFVKRLFIFKSRIILFVEQFS